MKRIYSFILSTIISLLMIFQVYSNKIFPFKERKYTHQERGYTQQVIIESSEGIGIEKKFEKFDIKLKTLLDKEFEQFSNKVKKLLDGENFNKIIIYPYLEIQLVNKDKNNYILSDDEFIQKINRYVKNYYKFFNLDCRRYHDDCFSIIGKFYGKEFFSIYFESNEEIDINLTNLHSIFGANNVQSIENLIRNTLLSQNEIKEKEYYLKKSLLYLVQNFENVLKNKTDLEHNVEQITEQTKKQEKKISIKTYFDDNSVSIKIYDLKSDSETVINFIKINNNLDDILKNEYINYKDITDFYNKKNPRYCLKMSNIINKYKFCTFFLIA